MEYRNLWNRTSRICYCNSSYPVIMAGPKKKARRPSENESDNESISEGSESGSYHGQQVKNSIHVINIFAIPNFFKEIQAMFEGRNPEGQDFHGIKQLLQQLFLKAHIDLTQMSDMLINQAGVGSVLKQGFSESDDEDDTEMADQNDVFGITTVINLGLHRVSLISAMHFHKE